MTGFGRAYHYGLEAGSKPELLAVMAMLDDQKALVVCNGYKDRQYVETALLASKLRERVIIVIEKPSEPELALIAEELRIAMQAMGRITGQVGVEDVLDQIFSKFCIGK